MDMSDSENEMNTIEKKTKPKRVASEKQKAHLAKIQPKATEAKKKNKEVIQTIKTYEKAKAPTNELKALRDDVSKVVRYLSQVEEYKINKRAQKKAQAETIDKETDKEYSFDANNLFR